ncbi:WD repeat-containing protein 97 isoform X2 [Carassius carassius]|uniref:WD repeat-containing protein 97 isoform X2 n=1 Tax=Carassius carassius TaxID=217509 RepID=UPI002868DDE7|nr:WD repeat-containing protein 97 isoform X2 [Carassius carassius]
MKMVKEEMETSQADSLKSSSPEQTNGEKNGQACTESIDEMNYWSVSPSILTHGLCHVLHLCCDESVSHMTCGVGAGSFASLHRRSRVQFYYPDGRLRDLSFYQSLTFRYAGLTSTHLPGRLVGWGPGAVLTVLDAELNPLVYAVEPMDVRVCKILEHSNELVTAGKGNVCVWCLTHLVCRKRVVEGLGRQVVFTHLALMTSRTEQGPRALAAYGRAVVVVDLTEGCIMEHKKNLHLREITGMVYCPLRDIVVTASDMTIRVWGPDWELQMAFVGHTALVTSLVLCPVSGLLLSSSLDGTLRCWRPEVGDQVQIIPIPNGCPPPLVMGGPDSAGTFFSYSTNSVDFWTFKCLYNLHCRLDGVLRGPVHQILTPPTPPSFHACVVCIHGNNNVTVVAAETGEVLTRFQANGRVRCADYCVPKDILLVLTEDGVVTTASTLTSPVTVLDEWHGIEHWDWSGGQMQANIGIVCCMVLYNDVKGIQLGQEEWRSLQMQRSQKPKKIQLLHDAKNRFLVVLGHCGGCVSVLNMHSGKIQFRTSAHNNQNLSSMQAYPNSGYLLTAGEDKALLVWRVFPCAQQCLSLYFSVLCDMPPVLMALMGTQLIVASQDPENDTYSLVQYSLESQSRSDQKPNEKHHNKITGLCACHQLSMFTSSSQDGTVRIWDMENHLLRILELNAEPECLAYCESGDLLLGITGDLYRIPQTQLLPLDFRTQKWYPDSELLKSCIPIMSHDCRTESCHIIRKDGPEMQDRIKDLDFGAIMALHKDLESLQKGEVECGRRKPANIKSKREAFNNYLGLICRRPLDIRIPEDMFDVYATLFPPKLPELPPLSPPSFTDGLSTRLHSPKTQSELDEVQCLYNEEEEKKREKAHKHRTPIAKTPSTQKSPLPPSPVAETLIYPPQKALPPIKSPTPPLTPPSESAPPLLTSVPPSPSSALPSPTSHLPEFLLQYVDEHWFQKMFPDLSCISSSLCPKEFCKHLLNFMVTCSMAQKNSILNALLMLIQQEVLDKESLSTGLLVCLKNYIHKNMSREEQHFVGELLNVLVYLSPDGFDTIVELLAMLANKEADLKALVLCVLQRLGVEEAELWLCPELESWNSLTKHKPDQHNSLRDMASHWLLTWTRKYKVHSGSVFLSSEGIESVFASVEVLKYFCSVQKGKQTRPLPPPPEGRKDAVIVHSDLPRLKPIQRLGETYSMSRIREPQGRLLPPLPYRPMLMDFPRFLSLPLAHVTLSPFPFSLDFQTFRRPSPQRYFFLERSYVQYYR